MTPRAHNVISYSGALAVPLGSFFLSAPAMSARVGLALGLWTLHFVRRTLESAFVHRYSKAEFPWKNASVEYLYYWGLGSWILMTLPTGELDVVSAVGVVLFALAEAGNARCHLILRNLRSAQGAERGLPRGFLFRWLSCPHYFCELLSFLGFALVVRSVASLVFLSFVALILGSWARTRHLAYLRDFAAERGESSPERRKALIPGVF